MNVRISRIASRLQVVDKFVYCPGLPRQTVGVIRQSVKGRLPEWHLVLYVHPTTRKFEKLIAKSTRDYDRDFVLQMIATQLYIGGFYDELSKVWQ